MHTLGVGVDPMELSDKHVCVKTRSSFAQCLLAIDRSAIDRSAMMSAFVWKGIEA
jgi:hypothetical protein